MAAYRSSGDSSKLLKTSSMDRLGVVDETEDPMMALTWFHPHLTRHAADCMLIDNAAEGSYLLRASSDHRSYVLCVKLSSSVQHIKVEKMDSGYKFGNIVFEDIQSFKKHFEVEKPVIGSDSGITVLLKTPYLRFIKETHIYTDIVHHAVTHMITDSTSESESEDLPPNSDLPKGTLPPQGISSKEGFLTKQGRIWKNWKLRWFVLRSNLLCYYKRKESRRPVGRLNMDQAVAVEMDDTKGKNFCFRVDFPGRTFYVFAASAEDCHQWVELLRSRLRPPSQ